MQKKSRKKMPRSDEVGRRKVDTHTSVGTNKTPSRRFLHFAALLKAKKQGIEPSGVYSPVHAA
jgi:hypothetical protein